MLRILLILVLFVIGVAAYLWFSVQSLPEWYSQTDTKEQQNIQRLSNQIESEGMRTFLGDKFADVSRGDVVLSEVEFNALVMSSLRGHKDGRRLLAVSDVVHVDLRDGEIEFGAVVNMVKLGKVEPKAKRAFEQATQVLPLNLSDKVFVAVIGRPIARNGSLALADDVRMQVGSISVSNDMLKRIGVPVHKLNQEDLPLRQLRINSVTPGDEEIRFAATPRF